MSMAHEDGLEFCLVPNFETARERPSIDREAIVEDERTRPVGGAFAAVTADDPELHAILPRRTSAAFRGIRGSRASARRPLSQSRRVPPRPSAAAGGAS